eukprot:5105395-Alexandrium_andersonii.AAC.1
MAGHDDWHAEGQEVHRQIGDRLKHEVLEVRCHVGGLEEHPVGLAEEEAHAPVSYTHLRAHETSAHL